LRIKRVVKGKTKRTKRNGAGRHEHNTGIRIGRCASSLPNKWRWRNLDDLHRWRRWTR
jgi:hypothetical protein